MDKHQRNVIINEKVLRKYLVLSPTVIKVMENDRLFPESFLTKLKVTFLLCEKKRRIIFTNFALNSRYDHWNKIQ